MYVLVKTKGLPFSNCYLVHRNKRSITFDIPVSLYVAKMYMYIKGLLRCSCVTQCGTSTITAIIVGFQAPEYTFVEGETSTVVVIKSATSDDFFTVDVSARMYLHV